LIFVPISSRAGYNITLIWTAPGDDNNYGRGSTYDIRYSYVPVGSDTIEWWDSAIVVNSAPTPSRAGFKDSCKVLNLSLDSTFYFSVRTCDEAQNWSSISNIANIPPLFCVDVSGNDDIDIMDTVYLLKFLYGEEVFIPPDATGDVDNSGDIDILDVIYIINYFYKHGPAPICLK
jgi:hypothetical protein